MFDSICTLPLSADLFAQAVHPREPLVAVGLSSGHVAVLRLPVVGPESEADDSRSRRVSDGTGVIETAWRTRRHKGSCRCLAYSVDGRQLYSAGADGVVKAAECETGQVTGKLAIPTTPSSGRAEVGTDVDAPTVVYALSPQTLLLATDSGALHLYDLRDPAPSLPLDKSKTAFNTAKPAQTHYPHTDYISSLSPIPPSSASTSGYSKQWLTTGGTTLALTDLRRGVLVKSEDQEEILLSSLYVTHLPVKKSSSSSGEKVLVGGGNGVITLWEKGMWDDQDERIIVSKDNETLDVMAETPDGLRGVGKGIAVGLGDGVIRFVKLGLNKVVGEVRHDDLEGVIGLGFDVGGRMISGGGQVVKVWGEKMESAEDEDEDAEVGAAKRLADSDEDDDDEKDDTGGKSEEEQPRKRRKKRKRGKAPAPGTALSFTGLD